MLSVIHDLWRRTFLWQVLNKDRRLGVVFTVFFLGQCAAQLLRVESTPFFLFGMYSEPIAPQPEYVRVACEVDGAPLTQAEMPRFAGELFFSALYRYQILHDHDFKDHYAPTMADELAGLPPAVKGMLQEELSFDPGRVGLFGDWTLRYLRQSLGRPVNTVEVIRETYRYVDRRPQLVRSIIILSAQAPSDVEP